MIAIKSAYRYIVAGNETLTIGLPIHEKDICIQFYLLKQPTVAYMILLLLINTG